MNRVRKPKLVKKCCKAKLYKGEKCKCYMGQSQKHGFTFENEVRKIFGLKPESNDRNVHDIPCSLNKFNTNENISIKTVGNTTICCGDILRFFSYDFSKKNTIIVIKYTQIDNQKIVESIYEIDYTSDMHQILFGDCTLQIIQEYVNMIKSIPHGRATAEVKKKYKIDKKNIETTNKMKIQINPKVDSKGQRRVQCSIPNFDSLLKDYIIYKSSSESPNKVRGELITSCIVSSKRKRNKKSVK